MRADVYRKDIDGLRAIAVLAVIFFHFGCLPYGYLGVDIFLVISGFLITGIIYREMSEGRFSVLTFYLRRTRRIIPLTLFFGLITLAIGIPTMLPNDLKTLAQSIVATNFFSNNVLQAVTTKNYWDVVNEYKPLMHTWSLGVEEQFYMIHPFLLLLSMRKARQFPLLLLSVLAVISLALYLWPGFSAPDKFYFIQFRFFELASGGIAAIWLKERRVNNPLAVVPVLGLIAILCFGIPGLPASGALLATVVATLAILMGSTKGSRAVTLVLENRFSVAIGKISFSMYMWHQVLLAFARYFCFEELRFEQMALLFVLMTILSIVTYYLIERPFRDKRRISTRTLLVAVGAAFLLTTGVSLYIHRIAGVWRDVPELEIVRTDVKPNMHSAYNSRVRDLDKDFTSREKIRVLVIGNSFARDWANVLLESVYAAELEIGYVEYAAEHSKMAERAEMADVIFYSTPSRADFEAGGFAPAKFWAIGTKNFGMSNGYFYNRKGEHYFAQRTVMMPGVWECNEGLKAVWGTRYLDLIAKVIDRNRTVPVFTPNEKFISQDCRHFTRMGAKFFAELFTDELGGIFRDARKRRADEGERVTQRPNGGP